MTPATDLTAVTAGVFAPIRVKADQTGAEFSTDESVVAANGYLYQSEVALDFALNNWSLVGFDEVPAPCIFDDKSSQGLHPFILS